MVAKKSPKKAARPRWPKGHPLAGRFAEKSLFAEFTKNLKQMEREAKKQAAREVKARERAAKKAALEVQKRATKDRKNAVLREKRAATRQARKDMMLRPDGQTTRADLAQAKIYGWGKASTSRMREGVTYAWHGVFRITAGRAAIDKIMKNAGSSRKLPKNKGDGTYEVLLTPWLGNFTPTEAQAAVPDIAADLLAEYVSNGARAAYLGAFYTENIRGQ